MIKLTARSFAELVTLPAYEQVRILHEQKYPKDSPNVFKVPFYRTALDGIRHYYRANNDRTLLTAAMQQAQILRPPPKSASNLRVLRSFQRGGQLNRSLSIQKMASLDAVFNSNLAIKLRFDIEALENGEPVRLLFNCRVAKLSPEAATNTLCLAHMILEANDIDLPISKLQYVDMVDNSVTCLSRRPARSEKLIRNNARVVCALWPTI